MKMRSRLCGRVRSATGLVLVAAALALSSSALAQRDHRGARPSYRGDISRFHQPDRNAWRGGHWTPGRHDGRHGWWGTGGLWFGFPPLVYAYSYPYSYQYPYPYPYANPWAPPVAMLSPPETVVPTAPPAQYWYYCEDSRTYYPYVATCPGGWTPVPATPSDASPGPQQ